MQSKVASYMKLDSQSDSECSIGNLTKGKYHILPTNDDEVPLTACHFSPASVNNNGLGNVASSFMSLSSPAKLLFLCFSSRSKQES